MASASKHAASLIPLVLLEHCQNNTGLTFLLIAPFILGMNGPRPSTWVFLCDLPSLATDTKVRFLGWYVLPNGYMLGMHLTLTLACGNMM